MAGVFIYKSSNQYYSFFSKDDRVFEFMKRELLEHGNQILWEKANTNLEKIENARKTKDELVEKLNSGKKVRFKKLERFFI